MRMGESESRPLDILTVLVMLLTVLVLLCYGVIFFQPRIFFNPFKPGPPAEEQLAAMLTRQAPPPGTPATPTATNTPSLPPTWTPTATGTPTNTPTATATPTPTSTPTRKPTPKPPPAPGEHYFVLSTGVQPSTYRYPTLDCQWMGITGFIYDKDGLFKKGVTVKVWLDGWSGTTAVSGAYDEYVGHGKGEPGEYEVFLSNEPREEVWHMQLFEGGVPASAVYDVHSTRDCNRMVYIVHWKRKD